MHITAFIKALRPYLRYVNFTKCTLREQAFIYKNVHPILSRKLHTPPRPLGTLGMALGESQISGPNSPTKIPSISEVMNLYARRIVSWALSGSPNANFVTKALDMDMDYEQHGKPQGLLFHSDLG